MSATRQQTMDQPKPRKCDFCGDLVQSVRRVALDREYDRLLKVHKELYSCSECFENKERQRMGLERR